MEDSAVHWIWIASSTFKTSPGCSVPKATAFRILGSLVDRGWLNKNTDKSYKGQFAISQLYVK